MMICDALYAFVDGELSDEEADRFREHLPDCSACQAELLDAVQLSTVLRRPQRPRLTRSVAAIISVAAALLVVALVGQLMSRESFEVPANRVFAGRLSDGALGVYRPYQVMRGSTGPSESAISIQALAELEKHGDKKRLATAYLLRGNAVEAAPLLAQLPDTADTLSDRALAALERGQLDTALAAVNRALAKDATHPAARWNRALILQALDLPLAAATLFDGIAKDAEPGWAAEAATRAESLRAPPLAERQAWQGVWQAGLAMVAGGALLSVEQARRVPGLARLFVYDALRAAENAERARALLPLAQALELRSAVDQVAARDFRTRAPWAKRYAALVTGALDEQAKAQLVQDLLAHQSPDTADILLGALVLTRKMHLPVFARLAAQTGDPWFATLAAEQEALALQKAGDLTGAETQLLAALQRCGTERVAYRCVFVALDLSELYVALHRLADAQGAARDALVRAKDTSEWAQQITALQDLSEVARFAGRFDLASAIIEEVLARDPDNCATQNDGHEALASIRLLQLRPDEAQKEAAQLAECGDTLSLRAAYVFADLARHSGNVADADRAVRITAGLRAAHTFNAGEAALADHIEGRALLLYQRERALALLGRAIATGELPSADANAERARAFSYTTLVVDAAGRADYAEAFALMAKASRVEAPPRCALAFAVDDERVVTLVRDANGGIDGRMDTLSEARALTPEALVPDAYQQRVHACAHVDVLADASVHGRSRLLPPDAAWSYSVAGAHTEQSAGTAVVVANVDPPPTLQLPPVGHWRATDAGKRVTLLGSQATPTRVLEAFGDASEIEIHAHGIVDGAVSEGAYIALHPESRGRFALTAREVRGAKLRRAPVVVLAACDLAATSDYAYRPWSLPVAFIEAGARAVFASSAAIPDAEAGGFFAALLTRIRNGETPSQALREERQRWLSQDPHSWVNDVSLFEAR